MQKKKKGKIKIKKIFLAAITLFVVFIAGMAAGFFIPVDLVENNGFIPPLYITGDVLNPVKIDDLDTCDSSEKIDYNGRKIKAFSLEKILSIAGPAASKYSVYLIAGDGRAAKIEGQQLGKSYIVFSSKNGWEAVNFNHPISSNVKKIEEIVVVIEGKNLDFGLNIINMDKNIAYITPGQVNLLASRFLKIRGNANKEAEGKSYEASTFELKHIFKLKNFLDAGESNFNSLVLMSSGGDYRFIKSSDNNGYFELDGNTFNYVDTILNDEVVDLIGVVLNPVTTSIMDVYYDATGFIDSGKNVMLIITDGLGYHQYEYAISNGYAPFLESIGKAKKALSVYKPVSNPGLAAMFTGKPPAVNGIFSRKQREPIVPTIFGELMLSGKKSLLVEGDIQILKTEVEASLHTDRNSNGTIDDEIFASVMESVDLNYSFIAVHFHSIDDAGHDYGDIAEETMERIKTIDSYIKKIAQKWDGKIIITSDHGMHSIEDGGNHGDFMAEDMIVPYIIIDESF